MDMYLINKEHLGCQMHNKNNCCITGEQGMDMHLGFLSPRLCSNGTRAPEATNIWPRATENIFFCWCWFLDLQSKSKKKMLFNQARVDVQRSFHVNLHVA